MKKIFIIISILACLSSKGQSKITTLKKVFDENINESIYVHTNTSSILVGETIFYKLYCLNSKNKKLESKSKIAYVELIDENNKSILKQKVSLNKTAQGEIFIPTELSSGSYKLIAYTNWLLNYTEESLFQIDILVVNPFSSKIVTYLDPYNANNNLSNENALVSIENKTYSTRSKVILDLKELNNKYKESNISISIKKTDSSFNDYRITSKKFIANIANSQQKLNQSSQLFYPEIRGEILRGKITTLNESVSVSNKTISFSIKGKNNSFKLAKTNEKGEFTFILDKHPNNTETTIQVVDNYRRKFKIELLENKNDWTSFNLLKTTGIDNELKTKIQKRSVANQIENAYFSSKQDTIKEDLLNNSFYKPYKKVVYLDEYKRFPTVKETIIEVLDNIFLRDENGITSIVLRDKISNGQDKGEALVLVDGILIQDLKELFEYNANNIDKVEYVTEKYVYGPNVYNGLIHFLTKDGGYVLKEEGNHILKTEIQRPLNKKYYYNQDYSDPSKYERIPDYRYQLLWLPEIDANQSKTISFYTSDITGQFEINIEGFTPEGKPISAKEYFEVK